MEDELEVQAIFDLFAQRGRFLWLTEVDREWSATYPITGFSSHAAPVVGRTRLETAQRAWDAFCDEYVSSAA